MELIDTPLLNQIKTVVISEERKLILDEIANQLKSLLKANTSLNLNFVCTHNSRRSQLAQSWSTIIANSLNLPINSYSSGTETTACNERTIASLTRLGFEVKKTTEGTNPRYLLQTDVNQSFELFSKTIDDKELLPSSFVAMMTCDHADENCPFIPEAIARIPFRFEDPKRYDDTALESEMYDLRSREIGAQLLYIYNQLI